MKSFNPYSVILIWLVWTMWFSYLYDTPSPPNPDPKPLGQLVNLNGQNYLKSQDKNGEWHVYKVNNRGYLE